MSDPVYEGDSVRAIVIGIGHAPEPQPVLATVVGIAALIGGFVTTIQLPDSGATAWCDEDGFSKRLPVNLPATALVRALGWTGAGTLLGTVVVTGWRRGIILDLPEPVEATWAGLLLMLDPPEDS